MGAKGGYKRVIRYECTTCGYDRFKSKQNAIECCDDKVREAEQARERARVQRGLRKVVTPRVSFSREDRHEPLRAIARAKCPVKGCYKDPFAVAVPLSNWSRDNKLTKAEAKTKAIGLVKAQIARHLRSRWGH